MRVITLASEVSDNLFYLLEAQGHAILVDPIDAKGALRALQERGLMLDAILTTHWHPDHVSGHAEVIDAHPDAQLLAGAIDAEQVESLTGLRVHRRLRAGDVVTLGDASITILDTPGHTAGHISARVEDHLLVGDTMFSAGAGNCRFGGDAGALYRTFTDVLAPLPDTLRVYPGHDYAGKNLAMAASLLPEDAAIEAAAARVAGSPERGAIVTTLGEERQHNVFMRTHEADLQQAMRERHPELVDAAAALTQDPSEITWRALRALRDSW